MRTYLHRRASVSVSGVTTVDADTPAQVTVEANNKLRFTIPRGPKGDAFTYDDFTEEQLEDLKGPPGDIGDSYEVMTEDDVDTISAGGSIDESEKKKFPCGTAVKRLWDNMVAHVAEAGKAFVPKTLKINGLPLTEDREFLTTASVLISVEEWTKYAAGFTVPLDVPCAAVMKDDDVIVCPAPDSISTWYDCNIRCSGLKDGALTFETDSAFEDDVTANIIIIPRRSAD